MKTVLSIILTVFLFQNAAVSQLPHDTIKTALVIVDIQDFYFPGDGPGLVNAEAASLNAGEILRIFREKKQLVVHVRHKSGKGFGIHKNVAPLANEKVITKEEVNSFLGTDLLEYLKHNKINRLLVIGMQTQMCLEAAVRAGHDFGFECIVVQDACATRDLKYGGKTVKAENVHTAVLSTISEGGYGTVTDLGIFREDPDKFLFRELKKQ